MAVTALVAAIVVVAVLPAGAPGQPECGASDYICHLNVNQGALTVIGLFLAVVTGAVAYGDYASGRRARQLDADRAIARFSSVYFDALYEALHNLFHISDAFAIGGKTLARWPQYDLRYAAKLLEPPNSDYLDPRVRPYVDHMLRNDRYIKRFVDSWWARRKILADTGYLAEHAMRFLLEAWRSDGVEAREADAVFEHLKSAGLLQSLTSREREIQDCGFRVKMRRSEAEGKPVKPGTAVLWLFDDLKEEPAPIFTELRDLGDPPPRARRPEPPERQPHVGDQPGGNG